MLICSGSLPQRRVRRVLNVVKTKQDVEDLWGCEPEQIKILGLDFGQACVLGASALIPKNRHDKRAGANLDPSPVPTPTPTLTAAPSPTPPNTPPDPATYYNLAFKQKAVYQPTFKHRRWMEEQKNVALGDGIPSISDIETMLPPRCGEGASCARRVAKLEQVQGRLDEFYNSNNRYNNHKWDTRKMRETEYRLITDRLLKVVGGTTDRKKDEANKVVIEIGLGQKERHARPAFQDVPAALYEAFVKNQLRITEIADMLCLQNRKDDVAATLIPMNKHHRPIRIMLETLYGPHYQVYLERPRPLCPNSVDTARVTIKP
ncbi:hypothetical protein EDD21DRAFT_411633 [Dissophora ornata]|nr:hypothetical protein EDD21DRAFT_411633 [Dissophora ornata]